MPFVAPTDASKRILLARVAVASIEAPARYETASQFELTLEQAAVFASVEVDDCQVDVCPDREGFRARQKYPPAVINGANGKVIRPMWNQKFSRSLEAMDINVLDAYDRLGSKDQVVVDTMILSLDQKDAESRILRKGFMKHLERADMSELRLRSLDSGD